jgi:SAM-dependent methyltransferase
MVHALKEVWRVLKPGGILIDLRPISVDVPLLILTASGWKSAGLPDQSPDRVHDFAANRAIHRVVHDGFFIRLKQEYFVTKYYWNNLKELKSDVENCWKEDIIVSKEIWHHARLLYKSGSTQRRVQFPLRRKLVMYRRMDHKEAD